MSAPTDVQIKMVFDIINTELDKAIQSTMMYIAEKISAEVKAQPEEDSWNNQTGNLRSSVRAATFKKGRLVLKELFVKLFATATEAEEESENAIASLAETCKDDYVSVIVAAMEYAGYVEALQNKQVLAGVWARHRPHIERYIQQGVNAAAERINRQINR